MLYSDGITEAENPLGQPFEESGLEQVIDAYAADTACSAGSPGCLQAVERHAVAPRFIDDLTILLLKRAQAA